MQDRQSTKVTLLRVIGGAIACLLMAAAAVLLLEPQLLPTATPELVITGEATTTETPLPTATPSPTVTPSPTPPPAGSLSTTTPDGLKIAITNVIPDAWPLVQAQNSYNDPPAKGRRMIIVTLRITAPDLPPGKFLQLDSFDFKLSDGNQAVYTTYGDPSSCGVVPSELDGVVSSDIPLQGNVCWQVPKSATDLALLYVPGFGDTPAAKLPVPEAMP